MFDYHIDPRLDELVDVPERDLGTELVVQRHQIDTLHVRGFLDAGGHFVGEGELSSLGRVTHPNPVAPDRLDGSSIVVAPRAFHQAALLQAAQETKHRRLVQTCATYYVPQAQYFSFEPERVKQVAGSENGLYQILAVPRHYSRSRIPVKGFRW